MVKHALPLFILLVSFLWFGSAPWSLVLRAEGVPAMFTPIPLQNQDWGRIVLWAGIMILLTWLLSSVIYDVIDDIRRYSRYVRISKLRSERFPKEEC